MIRPVILCGGAGTRLWPLSRQLFPKQLLPLMGQESLLQQTAKRLTGAEFAPAIIVSGEDQRLFIKRQLEDARSSPEVILLEPAPRNTSAAATLAAAWVESTDRDELLLLVPSDHMIQNHKAFLRAVELGAPHAQAGAIVTFGAKPTEPNTQYGYIEAEPLQGPTDGARAIARFVEKPDADKAAEYVATGRFYWNTGIFLLRASTLLEEMRKFLPESLETIKTAVTNGTRDEVFVRPEPEAFSRAGNISIDHGIMERTSRGMVVPVEMDWSDVGSWDAVWKLGARDANDNTSRGDVVAIDTHSSLLRSEDGGPLVAAVGLDQMAVIATPDAVFVSPLGRVSDVKNIVECLKAEGRDCVISASKAAEPWGSRETIAERASFEVRHFVVDPGKRVSPPSDRAALWIIVSGTAEAVVDRQPSIVEQSGSIFVPAGTMRSLSNPGAGQLEVVEIQFRKGHGRSDA